MKISLILRTQWVQNWSRKSLTEARVLWFIHIINEKVINVRRYRGISKTGRKNGETPGETTKAIIVIQTRTVMQESGVPFVHEILMRHDGHEQHKILGIQLNAARCWNFLSSLGSLLFADATRHEGNVTQRIAHAILRKTRGKLHG